MTKPILDKETWEEFNKKFEKKITSFVPDNETLSKVDWVGIMLFMQKELATKRQQWQEEAVEEARIIIRDYLREKYQKEEGDYIWEILETTRGFKTALQTKS